MKTDPQFWLPERSEEIVQNHMAGWLACLSLRHDMFCIAVIACGGGEGTGGSGRVAHGRHPMEIFD